MPLFKSCKDGVHRYEGRYDEKPRSFEVTRGTITPEAMRELITYRVYVHDICTRCGHVVKREG